MIRNLLRDAVRGVAFAVGALAVAAALYVGVAIGQGAGCGNANVLNCMLQGGGDWEVGGVLNIYGSGQLQVAGVNRTGPLATAPAAVAAGYKVARGQATTATASDTVVSGLATVVAVMCSFNDDLALDPEWVSCSIGDQAGSPAAGSFLLKTWKATSNANPTPIAATTFSKKVNWFAIGT